MDDGSRKERAHQHEYPGGGCSRRDSRRLHGGWGSCQLWHRAVRPAFVQMNDRVPPRHMVRKQIFEVGAIDRWGELVDISELRWAPARRENLHHGSNRLGV